MQLSWHGVAPPIARYRARSWSSASSSRGRRSYLGSGILMRASQPSLALRVAASVPQVEPTTSDEFRSPS
jgi:hypothetical protein